MAGVHGLVPVLARRLVPLLLILGQAHAADSSLSDIVGNELIARVDVDTDSLGDLADASIDVDAPEQLDLPAPPKAHSPTAVELSLVQGGETHVKVGKLRAKRASPHKLLAPVKEAPQEALTKVWAKSSKMQVKADDKDVDQLGGELQSIMSQLPAVDAPAADVRGKKNVNMGDDAVMEKESMEVPEKDDSANVVDGAMAYIRTRLATEEHKSLRLRQLLAQSVHGNRDMRSRVQQLRKQLADGAQLQKSLRTVAAKKVAQEEAAVASQTKRADTATKRMQNASHAAQIGEKAMKFLGKRLRYAKSQVAALLLNLANSTQQNKELHRRLHTTNSTEVNENKLLVEERKKMAAEEKELAATKAKLHKLEAAKKAEDKEVKQLDRQKSFLEFRQRSTISRDQILHRENGMLKGQLAKEIQREEQIRDMWSKESDAFTWQLRAERANASEALSDLEKARVEFADLRGRVQNLRERASHGEQSRHSAEDAANKAQFALTQAEAENKQLKGSVPWLEAQADRQRQVTQNATMQAQRALKERDTVKAILAEAQKNIVQLQGQYADALTALVVAQAGGQDTVKPQAPAPLNSIQEFAGLGSDPLGLPPPAAPVELGLVQVGRAARDSSLSELGRDSSALTGMMDVDDAHGPRVDLNNLLRDMSK